ncbi:RHS repeat-associated core domain-containing protein [bacterium]|nr:RHS repeat-associated core domain-containing protein [bacterium]
MQWSTLLAPQITTTTTSYTVDLAAPLSQVLSDGSTTYLYGLERLAGVGPTGTEWYLADAIGSVRLTLDDAGQPLGGHDLAYTPFGIPQSGAQPALFGFAGEQWDADTGLVYLRARWYDPANGTFLSRDPFEGFPDMPYSQHPYQYGYSNPALWTDPSGEAVDITHPFSNPGEPFCWPGYELDETVSPIRCVRGTHTSVWLPAEHPPQYSGTTAMLPGPGAVTTAPGQLGPLVPELERVANACVNLAGGILVWFLAQTHVDVQTPRARRNDEWTFVGYHGTADVFVPSIMAGINPPSSGFNQLGEGFYVALDFTVAETFAEIAAVGVGLDAEPVVLKVFAKNFRQMTRRVVTPTLIDVPYSYITDYDYLVSQIAGFEPAIQIKFNPRSYNRIKATL